MITKKRLSQKDSRIFVILNVILTGGRNLLRLVYPNCRFSILITNEVIASPPCHCERGHEEPVRRSKLVAFNCILRVCFVVPPRNDNLFLRLYISKICLIIYNRTQLINPTFKQAGFHINCFLSMHLPIRRKML